MAPIRISDIAEASLRRCSHRATAAASCVRTRWSAYQATPPTTSAIATTHHSQRGGCQGCRVLVDHDPLRLGLVPSPADGLVAEQLGLQPGIGLLGRRRHGSSVRPQRRRRDGRATTIRIGHRRATAGSAGGGSVQDQRQGAVAVRRPPAAAVAAVGAGQEAMRAVPAGRARHLVREMGGGLHHGVPHDGLPSGGSVLRNRRWRRAG